MLGCQHDSSDCSRFISANSSLVGSVRRTYGAATMPYDRFTIGTGVTRGGVMGVMGVGTGVCTAAVMGTYVDTSNGDIDAVIVSFIAVRMSLSETPG